MRRTSWISWRIYLFTYPIDVLVLMLATNYKLYGVSNIFWWALVASIAHASIAPVIGLTAPISRHFNNSKLDLVLLLCLGIIRGLVINACAHSFNLVQVVSDEYKILNSTIALPSWFIAVAIFVESRRTYQRAFQQLFAQAMRKEQETHERRDLLPKGESSAEELIARLQFITSNLAGDIQKLLQRPTTLKDYSLQASRIKMLIEDDLRPTSELLWKKNAVTIPSIPFWVLVRISLLTQPLRVISVLCCSLPFLFVGLNGNYGLKIAVVQCLLSSILTIIIFGIAELIFYFKIFSRALTNMVSLTLIFFLPFVIQIKLPLKYSISQDIMTVLTYQSFLSFTYLILILTLNSYTVILKQRAEVILSLESHLANEKYSILINSSVSSMHNSDISHYLHGEIQAGLTASSLLLHQAAKAGDSKLANEALERAAGLLNQDHANISFTRMATPKIKLEKIISGWKGIADISISLPPVVQLDETVLRNSVALIEEAISNSIRHARATEILVTSDLQNDLLTINIISNGAPMSQGKAGLGTKLFNDLASEWSYASESDHNRLTFVLVNSL